ncbi:MAG: alpha/beta fold family hydrolase [Stygiobacter sp.]|nr:MAG: alpha/beta fold family hydrolase [Stygiobacter sp.]KAF0217968.1 MAG: alpha/beta fold family [Ignavibacteria bacterium]
MIFSPIMRASYKIDLLKILMLFVIAFYISSCAQSIPALKYTTHSSTYTYSPDTEINYEMIGHGRKKIVFVHGFGTSLHTWDDIKELFPKDEFTLYLLDMKGFGNSSKPEDDKYSIQEQANIVAGFIRKINSRSLYLIGHSYGGGVALQANILLAKDKSKKWVDKLVLIDCLAYMQDAPVFIDLLTIPVINRLSFQLPNSYKAEYILGKVFFNKSLINEKLIERYASYYYGENIPYAFITTAEQINPVEYEKLIEAYKSITTKCLILWGDNDSILPLENGIRLSKEMPNARIEIISECGHVPHEEKHNVTFSRIQMFLKK